MKEKMNECGIEVMKGAMNLQKNVVMNDWCSEVMNEIMNERGKKWMYAWYWRYEW